MLSKQRKGELATASLNEKKARAKGLTIFDMMPLMLLAIMVIGALVIFTK